MKNNSVNIDTVCYLSETGHKNFLYPDINNSRVLKAGASLDQMPYIPMSGLHAYKVISSQVKDIKSNSSHSIIWIRKDRVVSCDLYSNI